MYTYLCFYACYCYKNLQPVTPTKQPCFLTETLFIQCQRLIQITTCPVISLNFGHPLPMACMNSQISLQNNECVGFYLITIIDLNIFRETLRFRNVLWHPNFNSSDVKYLRISDEPAVISEPFEKRRLFWESLNLPNL